MKYISTLRIDKQIRFVKSVHPVQILPSKKLLPGVKYVRIRLALVELFDVFC